MELNYLLLFLFLVVAFLYSSVGHGGASGYVATMVLVGYSSTWIRQDALILNLMVSALAFYQYFKHGFFQWKMFLFLALGSVPLAFIGARMKLEGDWYNILLGAMIMIPALLFLFPRKGYTDGSKKLPIWLALIIGAVLGLLSGLTGIGGGVLLSPLLILGKYAGQKETAAISAPFILVNSASGLIGLATHHFVPDPNIYAMLAICLIGGIAGSYYGAGKFNKVILKRILGVGLLIASLKLLGVAELIHKM